MSDLTPFSKVQEDYINLWVKIEYIKNIIKKDNRIENGWPIWSDTILFVHNNGVDRWLDIFIDFEEFGNIS